MLSLKPFRFDPTRTWARISCCSREADFHPLSKHSFEPLRCRLLSLGADHATAGISRCSGWCSGNVAACGARAAAGKLPTIGFLGAATASAWGHWVAAFVQRLRELGWIEGRTVAIEYRWAEGRSERYNEIAAEFVRLKVDVIVTWGTASVIAAKQATSVIPIVFALAGDPVGTGLVASLARPGGNVTGLSSQSADLGGKRLELLREVFATLRRLAIMANVDNPLAVLDMRRGSGSGPHARPRSHHVRNPASGGHRARFRDAQGSRGCPLCL